MAKPRSRYAQVHHSIWSDADFQRLSRSAQATYLQVLSQSDITNVGRLRLNFRVLARGCSEVDEVSLQRDLDELAAARFLVIDYDTDEVLVRSYMRWSGGCIDQPNRLTGAATAARSIESPRLRSAAAVEFRRIGVVGVKSPVNGALIADELDGVTREPDEVDGNQSMGSERVSELLPNPPERVGNSKGSETLSKGSGVGTGVGNGTYQRGEFGKGSRARASEADLEAEPPSSRCPAHADEPNPPRCGPCADARKHAEAWQHEAERRKAEVDRAGREARAAAARAAVDACSMCDGNGYDAGRVCDHDPTTSERAARGIAEARAALAASRTSKGGDRRGKGV